MTISLTPADCERAALAAVSQARLNGLVITVAVTDENGVLSHLTRMSGASALSVDLATRKSATAARTGRATHEWAQLLGNDAALARAALASLPDLVLFAGGIPVRSRGSILGAVGVSGAAQEQDRELAEIAAEILNRSLTEEQEPRHD